MSLFIDTRLSATCYDNAIAFPPVFKSGCYYRRGVLANIASILKDDISIGF